MATNDITQSNLPQGTPQGLPQVGAEYFTPIDRRNPLPAGKEGYDQAVPGSPIYDPFGIKRPHERYEGKVDIWGGGQDLEKSVATRSLGLEMIKDQINRPAMPQGLMSSLEGYAAQNPYLKSMFMNYAPALETQGFLQNFEYQNQLTDMLTNAYILGGGLYGSQLAAWSQAKQQKKARDLAKTQKLQAILGGLGGGLTGGGGGGLGGGGGGGGGGGDYGSVDTTVGLVGVLEL